MNRSPKIWITITVTATVTATMLWTCRSLFLAGCSSGYPYILLVATFPFVALLWAFKVVAPGWSLLLAAIQFPAYGLLMGRAWMRGRALPALLVPTIHLMAAIAAGFVLRRYL